jgi:hypothetical protein
MLKSWGIFVDIRGAGVFMSVRRGYVNRVVFYGSRWSTESFGEQQEYADDVIFLIGRKLMSTISDLMQGALNCVQSWCDGVRLNDTIHKKEEFRRICRPKNLPYRAQTEQSGQVSGSIPR